MVLWPWVFLLYLACVRLLREWWGNCDVLCVLDSKAILFRSWPTVIAKFPVQPAPKSFSSVTLSRFRDVTAFSTFFKPFFCKCQTCSSWGVNPIKYLKNVHQWTFKSMVLQQKADCTRLLAVNHYDMTCR